MVHGTSDTSYYNMHFDEHWPNSTMSCIHSFLRSANSACNKIIISKLPIITYNMASLT